MASFDFNFLTGASSSDPAIQNVNFSKCLCHKDGNTGKLTPFTKTSWETFRRAAKDRDDVTNKLLNDVWDQGPKGVCIIGNATSHIRIVITLQELNAVAVMKLLLCQGMMQQMEIHQQKNRCVVVQN